MKIYKISCGETAERGFDSWLVGARNITDALAKGEKKLEHHGSIDLEITSVVLTGETE